MDFNKEAGDPSGKMSWEIFEQNVLPRFIDSAFVYRMTAGSSLMFDAGLNLQTPDKFMSDLFSTLDEILKECIEVPANAKTKAREAVIRHLGFAEEQIRRAKLDPEVFFSEILPDAIHAVIRIEKRNNYPFIPEFKYSHGLIHSANESYEILFGAIRNIMEKAIEEGILFLTEEELEYGTETWAIATILKDREESVPRQTIQLSHSSISVKSNPDGASICLILN